MYFTINGVQYCKRGTTLLKLVEVTHELRGRFGDTLSVTGKDWVVCSRAETRSVTLSTNKA